MYKRKARVLFLCACSSCRSQMNEMALGYANTIGKDWIEAKSAGIEANGNHARTISIMAVDGVDISGQESTVVTPEMIDWADLLVIVCGHEDENFPAVPVHVRKKYWSLDDPASVTGSEEEISQAFRATRDEVKRRVVSMINGMKMLAKSDC